ncbi:MULTISPECIES: ABC transporter permease [Gracilibacillus]|uniref:ABC transporter permease n=1 Tax=Gracilibacillus dipsosauri TaxID=178340 RepID=A0A317KTU2_9BACI|nr:ABC transporter permease subunit [Gracilibacillus dipsosauri]PWU66855.1 ABC transporter permease [Gracilibacillus dipsosauri]
MQWKTIFMKELLEDWRSYKWIWVPLVFILFCIMDPLSTYYLPQIIQAVGGLPDGAVIDIPETEPEMAIMMSLTQMSMLGVLVVIAITMGVIAGERKSGVAELILVKPVRYVTYILAKWSAKLLLVFVSYLVGMLASWYYVNLLFGEITIIEFFSLFLFYFVWLIFVVTLTVFYNTMMKVPGLVLTSTVITIMAMSVLNQIFSFRLPWLPNSISEHITTMLTEGSIPNELWMASAITLGLSLILLLFSRYIFQTKEMAE